MKVFVAGATGALGRPTVTALVAAGHDVTGTARGAEKAELLRALGATPIDVDLYDADAVHAAVAGHDAVIHMATKIPSLSGAARPGAWSETDRLRRDATRHLVDAALATSARVFVKESISFMYADGGDEWIDESMPDDVVPYIESAIEAEVQTRRFAEGGGSGVVLRFALFYGPDNIHSSEMVAMAERGLAPVLGGADRYLSVIHTDDAAAAVVAALDASSGTYNVADDEPLRRRDWGRALAAAFAIAPPRFLPAAAARAGGSKASPLARSHRISNAAFRSATGWSPTYPSAREGWQAVAEGHRRDQRARGGLATILGQVALTLLALTDLELGAWALAAPRHFYDHFPGGGHHWVAVDGPYNEHLVRDFGALNLALASVVIVALVRFTPVLVRTAAAATATFGVPHLIYHLTHQGRLADGDFVATISSLTAAAVVLPLVAANAVRRR